MDNCQRRIRNQYKGYNVLKRRQPIDEKNEKLIIDISSDWGNDSWLATKRLMDKKTDNKKEIEKRFNTPTFDE